MPPLWKNLFSLKFETGSYFLKIFKNDSAQSHGYLITPTAIADYGYNNNVFFSPKFVLITIICKNLLRLTQENQSSYSWVNLLL